MKYHIKILVLKICEYYKVPSKCAVRSI